MNTVTLDYTFQSIAIVEYVVLANTTLSTFCPVSIGTAQVEPWSGYSEGDLA